MNEILVVLLSGFASLIRVEFIYEGWKPVLVILDECH